MFKTMVVTCKACRGSTEFQQPYAYHAGFGNQGFLYNDAGTLTLVWSSYDPAFEAVVGAKVPWMLTPELRSALESRLPPAPVGGRWRFSNPARCPKCGVEVAGPMTQNIYYLVYDGSVVLDDPKSGKGLKGLILGGHEQRSG